MKTNKTALDHYFYAMCGLVGCLSVIIFGLVAGLCVEWNNTGLGNFLFITLMTVAPVLVLTLIFWWRAYLLSDKYELTFEPARVVREPVTMMTQIVRV